MNVIPAIDILEGRCVRLYQGDYSQSETFNENPVEVAKQWADQGATRLHLVDLDGAKAGQPVNQKTIEAIVKAVDVPVQLGGGLRNYASVADVLALGVERAILGTVAVEKPELVGQLCGEFPGQIVVGIDARNGKVATKGWLETSEVLATELAQRMAKLGVAAIVYTDIHRDGTMAGPNIPALRELASAIAIETIASGGISSITDLLSLLALEPIGVKSAIVGRALYTGDILLKE
ncbi:MAG: 1-(5-phosphoribosyl)-5-[(5-phosphoribosylamino)methylideneamino]imidazole-4-carboxamide isomerase, partial [Okeania sp. SIO2H7]|nr:1-(5-phosphoribosyl)-5-[(5-phosphoribosylamino)methylideneamino]imidazole-4-carboxamide isomerase [Okeania sp. SIO2H7]